MYIVSLHFLSALRHLFATVVALPCHNYGTTLPSRWHNSAKALAGLWHSCANLLQSFGTRGVLLAAIYSSCKASTGFVLMALFAGIKMPMAIIAPISTKLMRAQSNKRSHSKVVPLRTAFNSV